ncbi:MAG: hypothetical protein A2X12_03145 [Bacteroidetes bacterium GWE2_29_8]|nr:MAG: hypothetical protein A2X12_03145 [Bacteroidetes bacterium GWE2_29_8]OFY22382.1 MAG: hypothetical protein A2X02_01905 [Bacteroidetes bacterium GWF2_29_10]
MTYFFIAVITSLLIIATFKLFDKYNVDRLEALILNYLIASIGTFLYLKSSDDNFYLVIQTYFQQKWCLLSIINGFLFFVMFYIFSLSATKNGVSITAASSKMSVIIPVIIAFLIYDEHITPFKVIGILLALASFYLMLKKESNLNFIDKRYLLLPILLFFGGGTNDSIMNYVTVMQLNTQPVGLYLFFVFTSSFIFSFISYFIFIRKKTILKKDNIIWGTILGILNFLATYYFLKTIESKVFDNTVFFPLFNMSIVGFSALMGFTIFKEKLSKINWVGIAIAIIAIFLITY